MVAMNCKSFNSFIIVATLVVWSSWVSSPSEAARPFRLDGSITKGMEVLLFEEGFEPRSIIVKGLGGIKAHSGPSPAEGHAQTLGLGGIKHSGPAPGQGNRYTDEASHVAVGGIKYSGSVSRGSTFIQSIKRSGPAPGGGH